MFLTQRQKHILQILLGNPSGVSIKQIEESLKISRRTVYREFGDLKKNDFKIENQKGKYFYLAIQSNYKKLSNLCNNLTVKM